VPPALLIIGKDLRRGIRNRSTITLAFVAPLALGFIFGQILGGVDDMDERITFSYGVVDSDGGDLGAGFVSLLDQLVDDGLVELTTYGGVDEVRAAVDDNDVSAGFVLPDGLSDSFSTAGPTTIEVIGNVDAPIATNVATSIAETFATRASTAAMAGITAAGTGVVSAEDIASVAGEIGSSPPLASITTVETGGDRLDFSTRMIAGMAIFFAFFVAGTAVTGILEEREEGTMLRLLAAPVSRDSILFGKVAAAIIIGWVALVALMAASTLIMGADWGPVLGVLPLIITGVLAATGILALVGGLAKNAEQAGNLQSIVAVSMAMLGGAFGMVAPDPGSVWGLVAMLTPVHWFLTGLDELAGGGVGAVLPATLAMTAMAVVTGLAATALSGKLLRP
jgi:ABC-2 type transport system permease protein